MTLWLGLSHDLHQSWLGPLSFAHRFYHNAQRRTNKIKQRYECLFDVCLLVMFVCSRCVRVVFGRSQAGYPQKSSLARSPRGSQVDVKFFAVTSHFKNYLRVGNSSTHTPLIPIISMSTIGERTDVTAKWLNDRQRAWYPPHFIANLMKRKRGR